MTSNPHANRLRLGRHSHAGAVYLLTAVVKDRQPYFQNFSTGRLLIAELRAAHDQARVNSLAWVVMPDHLHWLIQLEHGALPELMRRIKSNSARSINRQLGLSGRLWQDGYHDRALRREEDLRAVARYIVANPLRAGLVRRVGDYPLWDAVWV
ncbi:transposase [Pseudomonas sp. 8AS]|uniref:REP-associated tyrosine transposase n=1 Tax=Pseudomonas sp. 8AS TaxID=2653163 RepID=UPI00135B028F